MMPLAKMSVTINTFALYTVMGIVIKNLLIDWIISLIVTFFIKFPVHFI